MRRVPGTALTRALALVAALGPATAEPASGQIISPGELARPHAELEGVRACTQCHALGSRGIDPARCLSCHELVSSRIDRGLGLHGAQDTEDCGSCHKDHFGRDFDLLHLDEADFDHDQVGYGIRGAHEELGCRECHRPALIRASDVRDAGGSPDRLERTFLGLETSCRGCHSSDDPHRGQFDDRGCADCHDEARWSDVSAFDHGATAFPLTGRHEPVRCEECHRPATGATGVEGLGAAVFVGLEHTGCSSCHADPHRGVMEGRCESCHVVDGWGVVPVGIEGRGFDHGRSAFPLVGAHVEVPCTTCHGTSPTRTATLRIRYHPETLSSTYPRPVAEECRSCHLDAHEGAFSPPERSECARCHSPSAWAPSSFGLARHDAEAAFRLTGAHRATPCSACHGSGDPDAPFRFGITDQTCIGCHEAEDPHDGIFGSESCDACHGTETFASPAFDHEAWLSRLPTDRTCADCHADEDPHGSQFAGRDCRSCHGFQAFAPSTFPHDDSGFPLDGAHAGVTCEACHLAEPLGGGVVGIRYRPISHRCRDCHGSI